MGEVNPQTGKYIGPYTEWDLHGQLILERLYSRETDTLLEEHLYENNIRWSSKTYQPDGNSPQSFYHRNIAPPVISSTTLYNHHGQDRTKIFFNQQGQELYSVRMEDVSESHLRRYFNDILVFESILNTEIHKAPVRVTYYYPNRTTLIDYTSNGDSTGWWRLYDESGQELEKLPELEETVRNENNNWGKLFMPFRRDYKWNLTKTDWEAVREHFYAILEDWKNDEATSIK